MASYEMVDDVDADFSSDEMVDDVDASMVDLSTDSDGEFIFAFDDLPVFDGI